MIRIQQIDNLRGLAIVCMLLQHIPLFLSSNLETPIYYLAILISRVSAPIFFILTGYCTLLSFKTHGTKQLIKRSIEIFNYGIISNILRHQPILTINVLTSISAFILICTLILFIKSRYAYLIILLFLIAYSFTTPEIISSNSIQYTSDILKTGEYPIAAWLIYSIIGLGISWFNNIKSKNLLIISSLLSIFLGTFTLFTNHYNLSFMENTPPFLFITLGLIGIIYMLTTMLKSTILTTFGKNALFIYMSHLLIFSYLPVLLNVQNQLNIYISIAIYIITLAITFHLLKESNI